MVANSSRQSGSLIAETVAVTAMSNVGKSTLAASVYRVIRDMRFTLSREMFRVDEGSTTTPTSPQAR